MKHGVLGSGLDSQGLDVGFFGIEEVSIQVVGVTTNHPGLLVVWLLRQQFVEGLHCLQVSCLVASNLRESEEISLSGMIRDVLEEGVSEVEH